MVVSVWCLIIQIPYTIITHYLFHSRIYTMYRKRGRDREREGEGEREGQTEGEREGRCEGVTCPRGKIDIQYYVANTALTLDLPLQKWMIFESVR